ncbi:MAG: cation:proton antiporter [Actinobacteria bacterium]|nr:cation:proton antiporter [Actinomycetota bacterium]
MSIDLVLILVGAAVFALGLPSNIIKRLWLSVPLLALLAGVLLGPEGLGVVKPDRLHDEHKVLEELARVTLAVSLVGVGLQITRADLRLIWKRAASLLTIAMVGMWLLTSLGAWLVLGLEPWLALLLGAILTPTDPVVASALVTGRLAEGNLPRWLRRSLQVEAGANDGLALVFVLVPALVLTLPGDDAGTIAGEAIGQVVLALIVGAAIGASAAKVVDLAEDHQATSGGFFLVSALALALLTLGAVHALGGTGILGAFVAGLLFSLMLEERYAQQLEETQDGLQQLLVVPVFLLFGSMLPWDGWVELGWTGLAFAAWALIIRRPAAAALALAPTDTPRRGVAFLSWYGPIGVAAIYYTLFVERYALEEFDRLFAASTLAIAVSVLVFSLSATPGVRRYGGRSPWTTLRHPLTDGIDKAP